MRLHGRGAALLIAAALVTSPLLDPSPASATYEPGEPDLTWGVQVDTGNYESIADVDIANDVVWSVGERVLDHGPYTQSMILRHDTQGHELSRTFDGPDDGYTTASAVDAGSWGAVVSGQHDLEQGYVQRLDADGSVLWTTDLTDGVYPTANDVVVLGDTVYTAGSEHGQFGNFRVDSFSLETGAHIASRTFGTTGSLSSIVALDGEIVVGGFSAAEDVPGEQVGDYDDVLVALDPNDLTTRWQHQFGTPGLDFIADLTVWDGHVYWAGTLGNEDNSNSFTDLVGGLGAVTADGTPMWREQLGPGYAVVYGLTATSEGLVLSGDVKRGALGAETDHFGGDDAFLQGRAFTGETIWTEVYGTHLDDGFDAMAADGDRLFAGGTTYGAMFEDTASDAPAEQVEQDAVLAAFDVPHLQRPDLSVRTGRRSYQGDNTYGAARPVRIAVQRGHLRTATVRLEDDGLIGDRLTLHTCAGLPHTNLSLLRGHHDVSANARKGTFRTSELRPGGSQQLTLRIRAGKLAAGSHSCMLVSRSQTRMHALDRLRLKVVVVAKHSHQA